MIKAKCTKKYRDNKGRIYGYELVDLNGNKQEIKAEELKSEIYKKHIDVVNLTMTSDNRLIDKKEKTDKKPVTAASSMKRLINKVRECEQKFCSNIGSGQINNVKSQLLENEALTYRDIIDNIYKDFYMIVDITVNNKDKEIRMKLISESKNDNTVQYKLLTDDLVLIAHSLIDREVMQDIEDKFNSMYIRTSVIIREDKERLAREHEIKEYYKHNFSIDMLNRDQLLNAFEQAVNDGEISKKESYSYTEWDLQKFAASKGMVDKHNEVILTMHKMMETACELIKALELYKYNSKSVRLHSTNGRLADRPIKITYKVGNIELTKFKTLKELQSAGESLDIPIVDTGLDDVPYLMLGPAIDNNGNYIVDKCRIYFSDSNALDTYDKIIDKYDLNKLIDKMNKDYELVDTYEELYVILRYMYA